MVPREILLLSRDEGAKKLYYREENAAVISRAARHLRRQKSLMLPQISFPKRP